MAARKAAKSNGKDTSATTDAIIKETLAHLAAARASFHKLGKVVLTSTQRQTSNGKLRDGEAPAMVNVLDTIDAFPGMFVSIADKDGGLDDAKVETGPAREDIALWTALSPVSTAIGELQTEVADKMLHAASSAKDVTVPAYAIIRANAPANAKMAKAAKPSTTFYGQPAKRRAANQAKKTRAVKKTSPVA